MKTFGPLAPSLYSSRSTWLACAHISAATGLFMPRGVDWFKSTPKVDLCIPTHRICYYWL